MSKKKVLLAVFALLVVAAVTVFAVSGEGLQGRFFTGLKVVKKSQACQTTGTPDLMPTIAVNRISGPATDTGYVTYKVSYYVANLSKVSVVNAPLYISYSSNEGMGTTLNESLGPVSIPCNTRKLVKEINLNVFDTTLSANQTISLDIDTMNTLTETNENNNHSEKNIVVKTADYGPGTGSYVDSEYRHINLKWTTLSPSGKVTAVKHYIYTGELPFTAGPIAWNEKVYTSEIFTSEVKSIFYKTAEPNAFVGGLGDWGQVYGCDAKKCSSEFQLSKTGVYHGLMEYTFANGDKSYSNVYKLESLEGEKEDVNVNVSAAPDSPSGTANASTGMLLGGFTVSFNGGDPSNTYVLKSAEVKFYSYNTALCNLVLYPGSKDLDSGYKGALVSQLGTIATFSLNDVNPVYVAPEEIAKYVIRGDVTNAQKGALNLRLMGITYQDMNSGQEHYLSYDIPLSSLMFMSASGSVEDNDCYGLMLTDKSDLTRCDLLKKISYHGYYGGFPFTPETATFADVPLTHECSSLVEGAAGAEWLKGKPDGLFYPYNNILRSETAKVLYGVKGSPSVAPSESLPFSDVASDSWYYSFVDYLYQVEALASDVAKGLFEPELNATFGWVDGVLNALD